MSAGLEEPLDRILIPDGESPIPESYSCLDGSSVYRVDTRGHKVVQASADYSSLSYKAFTIIFNFFLINYSLVSLAEDGFTLAISEIGSILHSHPKHFLVHLSRFKLLFIE